MQNKAAVLKQCLVIHHLAKKLKAATFWALRAHPTRNIRAPPRNYSGCKSVESSARSDPQSSGRFVTSTEQQTKCRQVGACWQTPGAAVTGGGSDYFYFFILAACGRLTRLNNSQIYEIYVRAGVSKIKAGVMIKLCAAVGRASHPAERYRKQIMQFGAQRCSVVCFLSVYLCVCVCVFCACVHMHVCLCSPWKCLKGKHTTKPPKPFFSSVTRWKYGCGSNLFYTQTWVRDHQAALSNYTAGAWPFKHRTSAFIRRPPPLLKTYVGLMELEAVCKEPIFVSIPSRMTCESTRNQNPPESRTSPRVRHNSQRNCILNFLFENVSDTDSQTERQTGQALRDIKV